MTSSKQVQNRMYKPSMRCELAMFKILLVIVEFFSTEAAIFGEVSQLDIWITSSSLANKQSDKSLIFRQIEINWINAPLYHEKDYIALYLDSRPRNGSLPVSVHRVNGQASGQIITDYYLPPIDFYNDTFQELDVSPPEPRYQLPDYFALKNDERSFEEKFPQVLRLAEGRSRALREECVGYCIAYHSGRRILAENCLKTNPTWMQDSHRYLRSKSLPALMLPGTHNSATYPKRLDESVLHMINKYQQNQDSSVFEQLVFGIRYLDLRVGYNKVKHSVDRFWIYHDIFRTEIPVREVLRQVRRFLELTSHEIVIMDFHRFTVGFHNENSDTLKDRHSKLVDMILNELSNFIVPSHVGYHAPLDEYTSMGRRLLVAYAERDSILNGRLELNAKLVRQGDMQQVDRTEQNSTETPELHEYEYETSTVATRTNSGDTSVVETNQVMLTEKPPTASDEAKNTTTEQSAKLISIEDYMYPPVSGSHAGSPNHNLALSKVALFFPQITHLWPNKDSITDLTRYLNETACRTHFGELKSLMVELTPTVFGVISDKYDGNRKLAELVNRPVTDMIRDRWLHCVNIVASDYFLGNDLIRLSIHANKMRATHQDFDFSSNGHCKSFRRVEHLLDKSKIGPQFIQLAPTISERSYDNYFESRTSLDDKDTVTYWRPDGSQISLKLLTSGTSALLSHHRERRDSFLDSVSDGFSNLFSSFKQLLNL